MESDKSVYYSFKFLPFLMGLMIIFSAIHSYLFTGDYVYSEDSGPPDIWTAIIFGLVGLLIILLGILIVDKLVIVEMDNQTIKVKKDDKVIEVKWLDVKSINMIPTVTPPLYKLRLNNYDDYFLFNTSHWGFQFMMFIWDFSDMGELIREKKDALDI
jgi:hypothetical protein